MTEPYLILHKVRGEPVFDIAERLEVTEGDSAPEPMWIIPTSGHRAYPCWTCPLNKLSYNQDFYDSITKEVPILPDNLPDHYACNNETSKPKPVTQVPSKTDDFLI